MASGVATSNLAILRGRRRRRPSGIADATLQALHEVAIASGTRDLRAVAQVSVDNARDLLQADGAVVFRWDPDSERLVPIYVRAPDAGL